MSNRPSRKPTTATATRRLLIVDDNVDSANALSIVLRMNGIETETARDCEDFRKKLDRFHPDTLLVDINLPDGDGWALAREVRARPDGADYLLLALSGFGEPEDILLSKEAGFDQHLVKPVHLESIRNAMKLTP